MVDDEPSIADTLAAILRSAAYEVTVAYNAASALQHCNGNPPDFVISDVVMPGMNGVELAIHMRQQYPGLKIVLFSGMANATDLLEKAREQGYEFTLLAKPIPPADLLANLHEWSAALTYRRRHWFGPEYNFTRLARVEQTLGRPGGGTPMAPVGAVRNKIMRVESIIKLAPASDAAARAAFAAIVEALKEVSAVLDELEPQLPRAM